MLIMGLPCQRFTSHGSPLLVMGLIILVFQHCVVCDVVKPNYISFGLAR